MFKLTLGVLLSFLLGCSNNGNELGSESQQHDNLPVSEPSFEDIEWSLESVAVENNEALVLNRQNEQKISLVFDSPSGNIVGNVFCNSLSGHYVYTHGYLTIDDLSSTDSTCNESQNEMLIRLALNDAFNSRQTSVRVDECSLELLSQEYEVHMYQNVESC